MSTSKNEWVSAGYSWGVNFNGGYVNNYGNKSIDGYVRPCKTFELKKK